MRSRGESGRWTRLCHWAIAGAMALGLWLAARPSSAGSSQSIPSETPSVSLHITVDLQGRPTAPSAPWVTQLAVTLSRGEETVWSDVLLCDEQGAFEISGLDPMTYTVAVRGINTLTAEELSPPSIEGTNAMHIGPLLAGDLNGDHRIDIVDFSLFRKRFGSEDELADLTNNGFVDILDFSLLRTNFGSCGPTRAD